MYSSMDIIGYVQEYGSQTFEQRPFCEVDALIISQFSYMKWDRIVPNITLEFVTDRDKSAVATVPITVKEMYEKADPEYVYLQDINAEKNGLLLKAMADSIRFAGMKCNYMVSKSDEQTVLQFCAMVCRPENALPVVVFRGTDGTLVGWKENLYMAFSRPVPGQIMASQYLRMVTELFTDDFVVTGHSKGGNLATFAAMSVPEVQDRIVAVYSFDGPGFRPEILEEYNYAAISDRVHKYMPRESIVGILLEGCMDYTTVKSEALGGAIAHIPYKWIVQEGSFVKEEQLRKYSQIMHESVIEWVMELDDEQLSLVINTLFEILQASDNSKLKGILVDWKNSSKSMFKAAVGVDKETRRKILKIMKALIEVIYKTYMES